MKTIETIHHTFELLKKVNHPNPVHLTELAKELGIKKTALMQLALDNPKLFVLSHDNKGATITNIYISPDRNPYAQECLDRLKEEYAKILYVLQWTYYNKKEAYYLPDGSACDDQSTLPYDKQPWLWRNTKEKMDKVKLSKHYHKSTGTVDMWGGTILPYALSIDEMKGLMDEGWTLGGELPDEVLEYRIREEVKR